VDDTRGAGAVGGIVKMEYSDLRLSLSSRPSAPAWTANCTLGNLRVHDLMTAGTTFPVLIGRRAARTLAGAPGDVALPLFSAAMDKKPLVGG